MGYVDEFLSLKCSGDVLNIVNPLGTKAQKEITESMAIIKWLKRIAIKEPMKYTLYDLCAGNALTSILAVHLLPIKQAYAVDKRIRKRNWGLAKRFEYLNMDIGKADILSNLFLPCDNNIVISVHPCSKLAERVIGIYLQSQTEHLILMPCCNGSVYHHKEDKKFNEEIPIGIKKKLSKYDLWCWNLARKAKGTFVVDDKVFSPKNGIVLASKEK